MITIQEPEKKLTEQALKIYEDLKDYKIETADKYELASTDLKRAKELLKAIDEKRKEMTKPLDDAKKRIMAFFRPAQDKLNLIISKINQEMFAYRRKQEEEARKKKEEMEKQAEDDLFIPEVKPEIPKTEVKVRKVWKFRVKDKTKIKMDFLIPDEKTIGELVRKLKDKAVNIVGEGIEVYYEEVSY